MRRIGTREGGRRIAVIGHRGNSSAAPENTLAAFRSAVDAGADYVELDVRASAEGTLYCLHDDTLDRTTNARRLLGRRRVLLRETHDAQLADLSAGEWFDPRFAAERVPTLAEALDVIQTGAGALIEHKSGPPEAYVRVLRARGLANQTIVQSFDWEFLVRLRGLEPAQRLGALGRNRFGDEMAEALAGCGAEYVVAIGGKIRIRPAGTENLGQRYFPSLAAPCSRFDFG